VVQWSEWSARASYKRPAARTFNRSERAI